MDEDVSALKLEFDFPDGEMITVTATGFSSLTRLAAALKRAGSDDTLATIIRAATLDEEFSLDDI